MSNEISLSRFADKQLKCKVCGQPFVFTSGEQLFFFDRSLTEPKRCPECRSKRHTPRCEGDNDGQH